MLAADLDDNGQDELVVDLGAGFGLWILDAAGWRALSPSTAESIVKIDFDADPRDDLVVDFGPGVGVRIWMNDTTWADQSAESPDSMLAWPGDSGIDSLLMDCGPKLGIWFQKCRARRPSPLRPSRRGASSAWSIQAPWHGSWRRPRWFGDRP